MTLNLQKQNKRTHTHTHTELTKTTIEKVFNVCKYVTRVDPNCTVDVYVCVCVAIAHHGFHSWLCPFPDQLLFSMQKTVAAATAAAVVVV